VHNIHAHVLLYDERNITVHSKFRQLQVYQILLKLVKIWLSYSETKRVKFFFETQCRINEHTGQLLLVGPNALWPTQPKFWVGHGPTGPRWCSAPMSPWTRLLMFGLWRVKISANYRVIALEVTQPIWSRYISVTDRQTDNINLANSSNTALYATDTHTSRRFAQRWNHFITHLINDITYVILLLL